MPHSSKPLPTGEVSGIVNPSIAEIWPTEIGIESVGDAFVAREVPVNLEAIGRLKY